MSKRTEPDPLIVALEQAQRESNPADRCKVCDYLRECEEPRATALRQAFNGSIGFRKLAEVLKANDVAIGWRAVKGHRDKEHP